MTTFFITGIDTDIGKTMATGALAHYGVEAGRNLITVKLVQTGCTGAAEDLLRHRELMGGASFPEDASGETAPQIFAFPASPHLAARLENRTVNLDRIRSAIARLEKKYDLVLVEGAGGLAVPLVEDLLTIDFVREQRWPVILVTSGRLGSLNTTILAIEAISTRRMRIAGTIYNEYPPADPVISADSLRMMKKYLRKYGQNDTIIPLPPLENRQQAVDFGAILK
ncbi:MAG: dethiobiotin synthase [Planctomycetia bacterium]|nr:dethiobiotin synthase [Planctomycetia bacterium]